MRDDGTLYGVRAITRPATGRAVHVRSFRQPLDLPDDAIVIGSYATPDVIFVIERVAGMIFETGGTASHAAILAREFGVPCVVGATDALTVIPHGARVEISTDGTVRYEAP